MLAAHWDRPALMTWALRSSETTGSLMDHAGGAINPLSLIRRLPRGLHVPRLRDRIRTIVSRCGDLSTKPLCNLSDFYLISRGAGWFYVDLWSDGQLEELPADIAVELEVVLSIKRIAKLKDLDLPSSLDLLHPQSKCVDWPIKPEVSEERHWNLGLSTKNALMKERISSHGP